MTQQALHPEDDLSLGNAEDLLHVLVRHSSDCIKIVDLDGRIAMWNGACEDLYGLRAHEVLGQRLPHVPAELRLRTLTDIRAIAAAGRVVEREAENIRGDGSHVLVNLTLIPVLDDEGHPAAVLSLAREMAGDDRFDRRRNDFLAAIGRELVAPLGTIAGNARLLGRAEIAVDPGRREALASSVAELAEDASRRVEDMLLVTQIAEGRLALGLDSVDVSSLLSGLVAIAEQTGHPILLDFEPGLPRALADPERLRSALEALLKSAVSVTPLGEPIGLSATTQKGHLVIEVADAGPDLGPEEASHLLGPSYSGADERGRLMKGAGVGLAKLVTEAHGGSLEIRPTPPGATITMSLPISQGDKEA